MNDRLREKCANALIDTLRDERVDVRIRRKIAARLLAPLVPRAREAAAAKRAREAE
ncbi:MAG TPA: hypothetical protein VFE30_16210 [Anaeromyxobacteraceae bacterium]|nr:hypothetical protein [Anaeromyxobacteraceae bacterium]